MNNSVERLWKNYLKSIGENEETTKLKYDSWYFGFNKEMADELAELVLCGDKRATTSIYCLYEIENENLPQTGELSVVTDFEGNAKCIIEIKKINVIPFNEVSAEYAYREGEGDKSLDYWRKAHIEAFDMELKEFNMNFSEDILVVLEEFEVVYK